MELMEKNRFEYTKVERAAGQIIAAKIDRIYEDNDKRLGSKWFITRILCYIRDQLQGYSPRCDWKDEREDFYFYTEKQYEDEFHRKPKEQEMASTTLYYDIGRITLYRAPKIAINVNG